MPQHRLWIPTDGSRLAAVLHLPDGPGPFPCLVASHGLGSSKESDKYLLVAERFSRAGVAACRFDFRGCGESGGRFSDTTVSGELADLRAVIAAVRARPELDGRLALMGSSMGAFLSLFAARECRAILAVAAWACPADLEDLLEDPQTVRAHGLGDACLAEFRAGTHLRAPGGLARCLFVHGDRDEVVPVEHARRLYAAAVEPKRLALLPGADHRLSDPAHREEAVRLSLDWVRTFL
ncbi:MAG: alpha/beta hydrolase [Candidatus Methylomirabilales bacterium]